MRVVCFASIVDCSFLWIVTQIFLLRFLQWLCVRTTDKGYYVWWKPNLLCELMMSRWWGWDQEIKLHTLSPPDNVAATRSSASTCDAACLSCIKVELGGSWSLNTTCDEGLRSCLSFDILYSCRHLCFCLLKRARTGLYKPHTEKRLRPAEPRDHCCFQRRVRGSIQRVSWQVTATGDSSTMPTMTARLWKLIEGLC